MDGPQADYVTERLDDNDDLIANAVGKVMMERSRAPSRIVALSSSPSFTPPKLTTDSIELTWPPSRGSLLAADILAAELGKI